MRTTVTLDDDVERLVREVMGRTGQSFKDTLNQAIRNGLAGAPTLVGQPPFVVEPHAMGVRAGVDPTRLQQLGDELDVDSFLEVTRRLNERRGSSP